jgi:4-hydroxybenzoate polyprenyltransferase
MSRNARLQEVEALPPLVVDLDGTLTTSDTLIESVLELLRRRPLTLLQLPGWLVGGRLAFKRAVADRVSLDPSTLPYDERLLERLEVARHERTLVLCSAADPRIVHAVAAHLGLFHEVLVTDGERNLSGTAKGDLLVQRFGAQGFDYAANAEVDLAVFRHAREAWLVNPSRALLRHRDELGNVTTVLDARRGGAGALLRLMRPHQWVKNLLVFVPMLTSVQVTYLEALVPSLLAFIAFSLVASFVYVTNDLFDLVDDRRHPRKRARPLAAGLVEVPRAVVAAIVLLCGGLAAASAVSGLFVWVILVYLSATVLYSAWLKRVPLLDTIVLAGLYTLRVLAGAAAIVVEPSVWLLAFSMFFFLSLALAKRHSELVEMEDTLAAGSIPGRRYRREDLPVLIGQGSASGYAAVLVMALYIDSPTVRQTYHHPELIWLVCPLLLYWINKLWLNAQRREINDDPVVWALTNRVSRAVAVISVMVLLLARWLPESM